MAWQPRAHLALALKHSTLFVTVGQRYGNAVEPMSHIETYHVKGGQDVTWGQST